MIKIKKNDFYITTAIAYLNGPPHLGHALEIIQADCIARFYRLLGKNLVFQTGADEHGLKMYNTAAQKGVKIEELINENYHAFVDFYKILNISYDKYVRTSSHRHKKGAIKLWNSLIEQGEIYKGFYSGLYCIGCEAYKTYNELIDGKCPNHPNRDIVELKEENYFFKLSRYTDDLINIYENDEIQIVPPKRKNEILNILKEGMEDISFSRQKKKLPWGISVPNDDEHVMYVWADALSNYITNIGYEFDNNAFEKTWPADIHLIGKDIIKFHAIYWPAMLISAGLPLFKNLFVHGFLTVEGTKIGKSIGNVSDPLNLIEKYSADVFRFYLLKNISSVDDGSFRETDLIDTYNTSLADDLGNLVLRVWAFVNKDFNGEIPKFTENLNQNDKNFLLEFDFVEELETLFKKFLLHRALERIWEFIRKTNKYINDTAPWLLKKSDIKRYNSVIYILIEALRIIAIYIQPFIPTISKKLFKILNMENSQKFNSICFNKKNTGKLGKREVMFPKIKEVIEEELDLEIEDNIITYDEFKKIDIRVALVESIEKVPKADKLYKVSIDLGTEKRTLVAGLAQNYKPEELLGKKIVILANLEPRKLRGILSQGMLLAAVDDKTVSVLTVDKDVKPGTKIE